MYYGLMQKRDKPTQSKNVPLSKPVIDLTSLVQLLRNTVELLPDKRRGRNIQYRQSDAALSAFSVFFMQSPLYFEQL